MTVSSLLKSYADWLEYSRKHLQSIGLATAPPPTEYPCLAMINIVAVPNASLSFVSFIYKHHVEPLCAAS